MSYDEETVEPWIICSSGFWREGDVNLTEHMIRVECTWEQAVKIRQRWMQIEHEHASRRAGLDAVLRSELGMFKKHPLEQIP